MSCIFLFLISDTTSWGKETFWCASIRHTKYRLQNQKYQNFQKFWYFKVEYMCLMGVHPTFFWPCETTPLTRYLVWERKIPTTKIFFSGPYDHCEIGRYPSILAWGQKCCHFGNKCCQYVGDNYLDHKRVYSGHFEPPSTSVPPFLIFLREIQKSEISPILRDLYR